MQQAIKITGMTCEGCRKGVTEKLMTLPGVEQVEVNLQKGEAHLMGAQQWSVETIQQLLGTKYQVGDLEQSNPLAIEVAPSKWRQLLPLFLIFGYLIAATFFLQYITKGARNWMFDFMGLFFLVFSFFKFLNYGGFPASFARYDPIAKHSKFYAYSYPFIETALGLCFLLVWQVEAVLIFTFALLLATTVGVLQALIYKRIIDCACLGTALKLPMTEATLIENALMLAMCTFSLATLWF